MMMDLLHSTGTELAASYVGLSDLIHQHSHSFWAKSWQSFESNLEFHILDSSIIIRNIE